MGSVKKKKRVKLRKRVAAKETNHIAGRKTDTQLRNGRSEFDAAVVGLLPRVGDVAGDERESVTVNDGGALQKGDRSERNVVGGAADTSLHLLSLPFPHANKKPPNLLGLWIRALLEFQIWVLSRFC